MTSKQQEHQQHYNPQEYARIHFPEVKLSCVKAVVRVLGTVGQDHVAVLPFVYSICP